MRISWVGPGVGFESGVGFGWFSTVVVAANLRTKMLDLRGLDSSKILMLRDVMIISIGN